MTEADIIQKQLDWHKDLNQGCMYAAYLSNNMSTKGKEWQFNCFKEDVSIDLVNKIDKHISNELPNPDVQVLSFILPAVNQQAHLIRFIELVGELPNWKVISNKIDANFSSVSLRVNLQEKDAKGDQIYSWAIGFGPFPHFAQTRISPFTEISLVVKSKQFLMKKYDRISLLQQTSGTVLRRGEPNDAHIADMFIDTLTNNEKKDNKYWSLTEHHKRRVLEILDQPKTFKHPKTKAGITFVIDNLST